MQPTNQQIVNQAINRINADGGLYSNSLGAAPEYQKLVDQAKQQIRPMGLLGGSYAGLTRFDPSTKTRVPVTQEWVDEAVAEIVRLNIELSTKAEPMPGTEMLKVDRIWEAVRAASAV